MIIRICRQFSFW